MSLTEQYKHYLETQGYLQAREIPGRGICALCKYMYTVGIVWGLNDTGYKGRWCYPGLVQASVALASWNGQGDPPLEWIKYKGEGGERRRATSESLIDAALAWWEEHHDDTDYDNFDDAGIPRYNEPPEFVRIAQELKQSKAKQN